MPDETSNQPVKLILWVAAVGVAIAVAFAITTATVQPSIHGAGRSSHPASLATVTGIYWMYGGAIKPGDSDPQTTIAGTITATGRTGKFTARTGPNGRFMLDLVAGRYFLSGWTPHVRPVSQNGSVSSGSECGSHEITVHAGEHLRTLVACVVP
jgi:hypothetical protein